MKKKKILQVKFIKNIKIKKILLNLIYIITTMAIIYNIIYLINTTIAKKEYLQIFGISLFYVEEDLMKPDLRQNDLVIAKEVESEDININDIIVYRVNDNIKINKVFNIYNDTNTGEKKYVTKSNLNYYPDIEEIVDGKIIGKKVANIFGVGFIIKILQSKITTVLIAIILCLRFSFNKYMYQKKKERIRKKKKIVL